MFAVLLGSFAANAQTLLVSSIVGGPTPWRNFNLPNPTTPSPWPYAIYTGQPAGWQTAPPTGLGWQSTVITENAGTIPPRMWVSEPNGEIYGVLFRTDFNLTSTNGVFYMDVRPDNECEIFINGVQVGGLFNWVNGVVTVCVPNNILQVGNNTVGIQTTEWTNTATRQQFNLWQNNSNVTITPSYAEYCTDDAPFTYTGTPAGGSWAGLGMSAGGVFTPSTSNLGSNTLTYTVNTSVGVQPTTCPQTASAIAVVKECCPSDMASFVQHKFTFTNTSTPSGLPKDDTCCTFGFKSVVWTVCEDFGFYVSCYQVNTYNFQYTPSQGAKSYQICLKVIDCVGCEDEECTKWTSLYGLDSGKSIEGDMDSNLDKNEINVHPNPNAGTFEIRIDSFDEEKYAEMYLTDLSGKRVLTIEEPSANVFIENAKLPAGIYVFIYKTDTSTETEKILIQK